MSDKNYKNLLNNVSAFVFDVDGVMTNGKLMITTEGEMYREMNTRDGFAIKYALIKGYKIGIISGGTNEGVRKDSNYSGLIKSIWAYMKKILLLMILSKPTISILKKCFTWVMTYRIYLYWKR